MDRKEKYVILSIFLFVGLLFQWILRAGGIIIMVGNTSDSAGAGLTKPSQHQSRQSRRIQTTLILLPHLFS